MTGENSEGSLWTTDSGCGGRLTLLLEICLGIFPADSGTQRLPEVALRGASQGSQTVSWCLWLRGLPNYIERLRFSGLQPWEKFCPVTHLRPAAVCALRHTGTLRGCSHACTARAFPFRQACLRLLQQW